MAKLDVPVTGLAGVLLEGPTEDPGLDFAEPLGEAKDGGAPELVAEFP